MMMMMNEKMMTDRRRERQIMRSVERQRASGATRPTAH
ncbi:hypothetical protein R3I93_014208 [Phoxinus phoxinus]|uniref:Uncharacterized protein n=1 Tax=Phoxinus phoxinus TaxID=58324 RepID=A0AAN9CM35_9TELE